MFSNSRITAKFRPTVDSEAIHAGTKKWRPVSCPVNGTRTRSAKYGYSKPGHLKPYLDSSAGLDKWPANIGVHGTPPLAITLTKDHQLCVVNEETTGKVHPFPKPRFLDNLESFLKNELRVLGVSEMQPSDLRLQVFREAFELLIHDFKTYQSILSSIKSEYEMMISHQREEIRQLYPLKQMLVTVSEECEQKIMKLKEQEKSDVKEARNENALLQKEISGLRLVQLQLETQVECLQDELQREYHELRDETDARKLLVIKVNEYHMAQVDAQVAAQNYAREMEEQKSDPIILKLALKGSRQREKQLTEEVEMLEQQLASYVDVVSAKEYEKLNQQNQELEEQLKDAKNDVEQLSLNHDALYEKYNKARTEHDQLQKDYDTLIKKSLTPRPNWDKCSDYIDGGFVRWKQLSQGKHSNDLVSILLKEMTKKKTNSDSSADIIGDLSNDDGLLLIACQFLMFLAKSNPEGDGFMKKTDFRSCLEEFFSNKDDESLNLLMNAVDLQLDTSSDGVICFAKLFSGTRDGTIGEFLSELSAQYYKERREYIEDIWEELANTDPVTVEDLRRAITIVDPEIMETDLDRYLYFGFNVTNKESLNGVQPVELTILLGRLQHGVLRRIGKVI